MTSIQIGLVSVAYLAFLFLIATWAELKKKQNKSLINNAVVYSLSLGIYCTAWTFFGSVGRVTSNGLDFLTIYIGPTLVLILGHYTLKKIIRISKQQQITSIADFLATRYGKKNSLGMLVALVCLMAGIPYLGLQLKAISTSFALVSGTNQNAFEVSNKFLFLVFLLVLFTFLFGTRKIENDEKHEGLVFSVATESIIKLISFIVVGCFVTFYLFHGFSDIVLKNPIDITKKVFSLEGQKGNSNWFFHQILSAGAFILLPRQFQIAIVENKSEKHLEKAAWMFPLYMLLINVFVIPIALAGNILLQGKGIGPDMFVLGLPLIFNENIIALLVFIGGFSAASGMVIVESIAISTMVSNTLILPLFLKNKHFEKNFKESPIIYIKTIRRLSILFLIFMGLVYMKNVSSIYSLVSIGMMAFVAVIQFAPSLICGLYWKKGTNSGAFYGILFGVLIWFFLLIVPSFNGFGSANLKAIVDTLYNAISIPGLDRVSVITFWSLLINTSTFYLISIAKNLSTLEYYQSILYVDVFKFSPKIEDSVTWKGIISTKELIELLNNFIGKKKAKRLLSLYAQRSKLDLSLQFADARLVNYTENILSGIIGNSSARMLISNVAKEESITKEEMQVVVEHAQKLYSTNTVLKNQTKELMALSDKLKVSNQKLVELDQLKSDFLSTVSHEIKTPVTSIRAFSEILRDNEDISSEDKSKFLNVVVKESERLTRLINQVLNLEKYESGNINRVDSEVHIKELIESAILTFNVLIKEKNISVNFNSETKVKMITADQDKVFQVLLNLISNAIKFVPKTKGEINVFLRNTEKEVEITVSDNGPGIKEDEHELVFGKFYQVKNQSLKKPIGTGLGLSISRKIAELHGGNLVYSPNIKGASFTFTLPIN